MSKIVSTRTSQFSQYISFQQSQSPLTSPLPPPPPPPPSFSFFVFFLTFMRTTNEKTHKKPAAAQAASLIIFHVQWNTASVALDCKQPPNLFERNSRSLLSFCSCFMFRAWINSTQGQARLLPALRGILDFPRKGVEKKARHLNGLND